MVTILLKYRETIHEQNRKCTHFISPINSKLHHFPNMPYDGPYSNEKSETRVCVLE